jgi:hypothetical protein
MRERLAERRAARLGQARAEPVEQGGDKFARLGLHVPSFQRRPEDRTYE